MAMEPKMVELGKIVTTFDDKIRLAEKIAADCPRRNEKMEERLNKVVAKSKKLDASLSELLKAGD